MFNLAIAKTELLPRLLMAAGAVDKKQSLAILSNFLLTIQDGYLSITATDLEIEIVTKLACGLDYSGSQITVPAKKFIDIVRSLDDEVIAKIQYLENTIVIKAGQGKFKLATLPAAQFPLSQYQSPEVTLTVAKIQFINLLQSTYFAMSQQDVRIFLNGLLLEIVDNQLITVATDGHRMAICKLALETQLPHLRLLLPRKAVLEVLRLLNSIADEIITITAGKNYFSVICQNYTFTSKLIEARFPAYTKAIPRENDKFIIVDKAPLKRALSRIIILAHEKSRAVLMHVQSQGLMLVANNQEQEEATETIKANVDGAELKIGINASYLLDVLAYLPDGLVRLSMSAANRSILIESLENEYYQYIIMPMKL